MAAEPAKKTLAVDDEVNMRVTVKKYLEFLKFEAHAACNDPRRVWRERAVLAETSSIIRRTLFRSGIPGGSLPMGMPRLQTLTVLY